MKIRFLEPGNRPYRRSLLNYFVYERTIRHPLQRHFDAGDYFEAGV